MLKSMNWQQVWINLIYSLFPKSPFGLLGRGWTDFVLEQFKLGALWKISSFHAVETKHRAINASLFLKSRTLNVHYLSCDGTGGAQVRVSSSEFEVRRLESDHWPGWNWWIADQNDMHQAHRQEHTSRVYLTGLNASTSFGGMAISLIKYIANKAAWWLAIEELESI